MTKLLNDAFEVVGRLPPDAQDDIARAILALAGQDESAKVNLTAQERATIAGSKAAAANADFATDEDVRALWAKHHL